MILLFNFYEFNDIRLGIVDYSMGLLEYNADFDDFRMNELTSGWFVKENDSTNQGLGFKSETEHAVTLKTFR